MGLSITRKSSARAASQRITYWLVILMLLPVLGIRAQNAEASAYRVAYILYGDAYGEGQIWTMNPDGSDQQMFSDLPSVLPAIAPDGAHIAYIANETGSDYAERLWDLNVVNVSTGEVYTLVSQERVTHISWSPDGDQLLYFKFNYDELYRSVGDLFVANADGSSPHLLVSDQFFYPPPAWSPDGSTILFTSREGDVETLYIVNADGTNLRALHDDIPCFICDAPRWTVNGQYIVYMDYPDLYRMDVTCIDQPETCDAATLRLTDFSDQYNAIDVAHSRYGQPAYSISSDSRFLVYTFGYRYQGGGIDIASMSFDGEGWANRQVLYHGDFYLYGAMLSPDDSTIFFNDENTIYRMNVDGSELIPLLEGNLYGFMPATG